MQCVRYKGVPQTLIQLVWLILQKVAGLRPTLSNCALREWMTCRSARKEWCGSKAFGSFPKRVGGTAMQ